MSVAARLDRPRTKIVATIGPATATAAAVDELLDEGLDVARVNCAHGTPESLREMIGLLRERSGARDVPLAILADLAGPKIRVGRFAGGEVQLEAGQEFVLTTADVEGDASRVSVDYAGFTRDVAPGTPIFLNDGLLRLVATAVDEIEVKTRVEIGGLLGDRKGISLPTAATSLPSVTDTDWRDLDCVLPARVGYVGLSFVRSPDDVQLLRRGIAERGHDVPVVAKIEKGQAVECLEEIVRVADAVMVARGDLGVECPIESVPVLQKRIIETCKRSGTPVITATQMLESMVSSPLPTRAEATDVANAVLDGTDAVMLSAETAVGRFPAGAVRTMRRIIRTSEAYAAEGGGPAAARPGGPLGIADATARGACLAAETAQAAAIVCLTQSGATARYLARWRPRQPLVAFTLSRDVQRRLSLVWGIRPRLLDAFGSDFDEATQHVKHLLREQGALEAGTPIVLTAGLPFPGRARTNTLRIEQL